MGFSIGSHASKEKTVRYRFNLSHKVDLNGDNPWLDAHKLVCLVLVLVCVCVVLCGLCLCCLLCFPVQVSSPA